MTGSLLFMNFCVMIGSNRFQVNNDEVCCGIAILVHYFTLSSIMWSCVMGHHLTKVMETDFTRLNTVFLCKRCLIAWGTSKPSTQPRLINLNSNRYPTLSYRVWLRSSIPHPILGILAVQMLIGLSWIAAYISTISSLLDYSIYFVFIHFTLNGILGVTVLFFHLLLRKDARAAWIQCCDKRKSYASNRRRVAGKGTLNARGTAGTKNEGDYTLVIDRASQKETSCHRDAGDQQPGASGADQPDVTSSVNTVRSRVRDCGHRQLTERQLQQQQQHQHQPQHRRVPSDGSSSAHPSYRLSSGSYADAQRVKCHGERSRTSSMSGYAVGPHLPADCRGLSPYEPGGTESRGESRVHDGYKTMECERHQSVGRRPSKSIRGQDGLVNTRV
ncbi:hypothetical protein LSH36_103g06065 [Paralvinella palmiformis]|uniref:G-protein coupled receptors family 2 profile 2 domain-containing protein n=1 Tax=Paralvinella palmiformis TaxID=53620 RepID=A0AAD9K1F0_9ANNE|nr:hypothetical protein LSH36_103g06065 [Paralvinella palmiformis]